MVSIGNRTSYEKAIVLQTTIELGKRASSSVIAVLVLFVMAVLTTHLPHKHAIPVLIFGIGVLAVTIARWLLSLHLKKISADTLHASCLVRFKVATYASAVLWGCFVFLTLWYNGIDWQSTILLIMTCGIASGASNSLSPDLHLAKNYLIVLLIPILAWGSWAHTYISLVMTLVTSFYLLAMIVIVKKNHEWFIESARNAELLRVQANHLQDIVEEIKQNSDTVTSSSKKFSDLSLQVSRNTDVMTARVGGIASSMERMSAALTAISIEIDTATTTVKAASASVGEISTTTRRVAEETVSAQEISRKAVAIADLVDKRINGLNQITQKVGTISTLIGDISGKTGLLALNTAIQAASMGGTSHVFTIIASEIKALSRQTENSAAEIDKQISEIHSFAKEMVRKLRDFVSIVLTMDQNIAEISQVIRKQSAETGSISTQMDESSKRISAINETIAANSEAAKIIARDILQVTNAAQDVARNCTIAKSGSNELVHFAEKLKKSAFAYSVGESARSA